MSLIEVRGNSLQDALLKASAIVGGGAIVVARTVQSDGSITLGLQAPTGGEGRLGSRQGAVVPSTSDTERFMRANGASQALIDRVCEAVLGRIEEDVHPLDLAAEEIGLMFPIARITRAQNCCRWFVTVGATGVGKTTSLMKLAIRLQESGRRPGVVILSRSGRGVAEWQRVAAQRQLHVKHIVQPRGVIALAEELALHEVVLVDSEGEFASCIQDLGELRNTIETNALAATWTTCLVLPATSSQHSLEHIGGLCRSLEPTCSIVTKLDECPLPAPVLECILHQNLPVAFLANAAALDEGLHRAAPQHFADLLLTGRIRS